MTLILNFILAICCFGSFAWAVKRFFVPAGGIQTGMRAITYCGAASAVLHLAAIAWARGGSVFFQLAGAACYVSALALFWWTVRVNAVRPLSLAYCEDEPGHLVKDGPYRFVRHPFYSAYMLAWIGGVLAAENPFLLVTCVVMFRLYWAAAQAEELKFLNSPLREEYTAYQSRTGRFFPVPRLTSR